MVDPWTIPTAGLEAYKHREEIASIIDRLVSTLRGEKSIVAVTGMPGVGKSVLLDHLSGAALKADYVPPGHSRKVERGIRRAQRLRILFRAIPGQQSPVRVQGLDDLFNAKRPVAGLLHVVANGYSQLRSSFAKDQLEEEMTLAQYQQIRREAEINDLRATLNYVRGAMLRHKRPFWVVVAVNKADLFASPAQLADAQEHYTRKGGFLEALEEFVDQVGEDNAQWEALPVSTWSETFQWRDEEIRPALDRAQQLHTLRQLAKAIEEHSGK